MTWSKLLCELTTDFKKDNKKKEKKTSEKVNRNETKKKKKIVNNQWIENTSIIERWIFSRMIVERKNYVFIMRKKNIK